MSDRRELSPGVRFALLVTGRVVRSSLQRFFTEHPVGRSVAAHASAGKAPAEIAADVFCDWLADNEGDDKC
jgi:hypothetical protein